MDEAQILNQVSSESLFDVLFILNQLRPVADGATLGEIQAFAYLGCLLSLFEGEPSEQWKYSFVAVPPTLPYSVELRDAVDVACGAGLLLSRRHLMILTERGAAECGLWAGLSTMAWRRRYLEGATGASLVSGLPALSNDLSYEPQLQRAARLGKHRELMQTESLSELFDQFTALRTAIGSRFEDLMTPAAVYLAFLASEHSVSDHRV